MKHCKSILALTMQIMLIIKISTLSAATYYVDTQNGNDSYSGTSQIQPWQTLSKVNGTTFQAGDSILFKADDVWTGRLYPGGSGSPGAPIVIDIYGTGSKAIIDGNGSNDGTIYLYNQAYWEISNLEITNDAEIEADRVGVRILAANYGVVNHIHLKNLFIHDIKGIVGSTMEAKNTGGINIRVDNDATVSTRFNDILIENCVISSCDGSGISNIANTSDYPGTGKWDERKYTNYIIRNNSINDISKNAMILRMADASCLVEYNVCWDTANRAGSGNTIFSRSCLGTVFQFNEGFLNRSSESIDGSLYDADIKSPGCVFQYSYSHDNNHGLFWSISDLADTGIVVRYNISQNDKGRIFRFNSQSGEHRIYNNTIYIPSHLSPVIIRESTSSEQPSNYYYYNNIIYNLSTSASYVFGGSHYNRIFENNCFYGNHPSNEPYDPKKVTANPLFEGPGSGGQGIHSVDGYKLKPGSPCIDAGRIVADNGGRDYFGNPLYNEAPDIGAHEYYEPSLTLDPDQINSPIPAAFQLKQNYPNPFNLSTTIGFQIPEVAHVRLDIYDLRGQLVRSLVDEMKPAGAHQIKWNGKNSDGNIVASGVFFYRIVVQAQHQLFTDTGKMVLVL